VSDLISRLASRAVGATPLARPRVALPVDAVAEPASRTPVAVRPEAPVARATPATPAVRSEPEVPAEPTRERQRAEEAAAVTRERVVERTVVRETAVPTVREQEPQSAPERVAARESVATVPAVPAATSPVAARAVEGRVERTHTTSAAAVEEPPVRVHIGRLEVRANLQQAPPPSQPRPKADRSEGLSLGDYLRGRRSA
jgi:hypothetical protein